MEASKQPSAEELEQATAVGAAGAQAIAESKTEDEARKNADAAIKRTAKDVNLKLSDEDRKGIVDDLIERMSALGAFDPPPAPPAPEPARAAEAAAEAAAVAPPEKKTWAERFAGT